MVGTMLEEVLCVCSSVVYLPACFVVRLTVCGCWVLGAGACSFLSDFEETMLCFSRFITDVYAHVYACALFPCLHACKFLGVFTGYDWKFNETEWVTTLKLLNMGLDAHDIQVQIRCMLTCMYIHAHARNTQTQTDQLC